MKIHFVQIKPRSSSNNICGAGGVRGVSVFFVEKCNLKLMRTLHMELTSIHVQVICIFVTKEDYFYIVCYFLCLCFNYA